MAIKSEYAKLSMAVYSDTDVAGWTKLIVDLPPTAQASGFFARAYQNNATNEVVIVYRGTEFPSDPGDLTADAALATDAEHQQFIDALEFARQVYQKYDQQGYQISVTGHSLGGGLAQLAADVFGWNGVTFEAPGTAQLRDNSQFVDWFTEHSDEKLSFGNVGSDFENIVVAGSAISSVGKHIGTVDPAIDTGAGGNDVLLLMKAATIGFAPAVAILAVTEQWASSQLNLHSISNIYQYLERQTAAGTVLQDYIGQYLDHGVDGYDPPDRSLPDVIREFFDDRFNGSQELSQAQAEALVGDLQWLRDNDPLFAENTAAMDDLIKAQDMLRIATQDIVSVTLDNAHWTADQFEAENQLTIRINLEHVVEKTSQNLEVKLPDIDLWSGQSSHYVVLNGEAVFVENALLGENVFDHFVLNVEPGAQFAEFKIMAIPVSGEEFPDGRNDLGAFKVSLPGRSGSGMLEYSGELTLFDTSSILSLLELDDIVTDILIQGDLAPETNSDGDILYDSWGNIIPDGDAPGRADTIYDTLNSDLIQAGSGNDYVTKKRGGNDVVELGDGDDDFYTLAGATGRIEVHGGDGRDYAGGGTEVDVIEGGTGADGLYGDAGDDRLYGDSVVNLNDFIAQGVSQAGSGEQGEWFDGGTGEDVIVGGSGDDLVAGGDGNDVIATGGGSDWIWGDQDTYSNGEWRNWSVTETVEIDANGNNSYTYEHNNIGTENDTGVGDDVIHAGGGDDVVFGEGGSDTVYLEDGADKSWGGAGDDVMLGGAGDDLLSGDNGKDILDLSLHGNDFLDGGDGADEIFGDGGSDVLLGGAGDDRLTGDSDDAYAGDDYLDGESGNDTLIGAAGNDTLYGGAGDDMLSGDASNVAGDLQGDDYLDGGEGNDVLLGGGGADVLLGGMGNDELYGETGEIPEANHADDYLDGGEGDDVLAGGGGSDILIGGAGADTLDGDSGDTPPARYGDDSLAGGDGDDTLIGNGGDDTLDGGADNDALYGDGGGLDGIYHGNDRLDGGAGDDILMGMGGDDVLLGGDGADQLDGDDIGTDTAYHGSDWLDGGAGDDVLVGGGKNDVLYGGDGADTLDGDGAGTSVDAHGDDQLNGGAGDDILIGNGGSDSLNGGDDNDSLYGDANDIDGTYHGDDTLDGGAGNDLLMGMGGADVLYGGSGADTLLGDDSATDGMYHGADYLDGGVGDDLLLGGGGSDTLLGGEGDDQLGGDDLSLGAAYHGDDVLDGGAGDDVLSGMGGADTLYGGDGHDSLEGGDGADYLDGGADFDELYGGAGNDTLAGGGGADYLDGGSGDDLIEGGVGDDTLVAGQGSDVLEGGDGTDIYLYNLSDGVDFIRDSGSNTLRFGYGISLSDISLALGSLKINVGNGGDAIHIEGFDPDAPYTNVAIDRFEFNDGTVLDFTQLLSRGFDLTGTEGADVIEGTVLEDRLNGLGGDDILLGKAGNDTLDGGVGADDMRGMAGDDLYLVDDAGDSVTENADEGYDRVESSVSFGLSENIEDLLLIGDALDGSGNSLNNVVEGNSLDNHIEGQEGDDILYGKDGNDTLHGGAGADWLAGDDGDDILDGGSGNDIFYGGFGDDTYVVDNENDRVTDVDDVMEWGAVTDDEGNTRYASVVRSGGQDTVVSSVSYTLGQSVEKLVLTGTSEIDGSGTQRSNYIEGNDAANTLYAYRLNGRIDNYADAPIWLDTTPNTGLDERLFDRAVEAIYRGGMDTSATYGFLHSVAGEGDVLIGGGGDDRLFGDLDNDVLRGGGGNDVLYGFGGSDVLIGGQGDDTYIVDQGYHFSFRSRDTLIEYNDDGVDELVEEENGGHDTVLANADYVLASNIEDLVLLNNTEAYDQDLDLYGEGVDLGHHALAGTGNGLDNHISGNIYDNELYGLGGVDTLIGGQGNDTLDGGAGADVLQGGIGNDTYVVDSLADQVVEMEDEGTDTVQAGIDCVLGNNVENLTLVGNQAISGDGNELNNVLLGNAADNVLSGFDGNDTLESGGGADRLLGGNGDDSYIVHDADSQIVELAGEGRDSVYADITYALSENVEDLYLTGSDAIDGVGSEQDNRLSGNAAANELNGMGGNDQLDGKEGGDSLFGGAGNDELHGGEGADQLNGGTGDDFLYGDSDADILQGGIGNDRLEGGDGDDVLLGADGADTLYGGAGTDRLEGGSGDDTLQGNGELYGDAGADTLEGTGLLSGGAGDDVLTGLGSDELLGGDGNDVITANADIWISGTGSVLEGGAGDDELYGSFADDTYRFDLGDGNDRLIERREGESYSNIAPSFDTLSFGAGVALADLAFERHGDDLFVRHASGADSITIERWFEEPSEHFKVNRFIFADGMELSDADVEASVVTYGTAKADTLLGYRALDEELYAGDGDDQVWGRGGDDALYGEAGADYLDGEAGADRLYGGAGADNLQGQDGEDSLDGGADNDYLAGGSDADSLWGGEGDDVLNGEDGDDVLMGGAGNDDYYYGEGGGVDVIDNAGGGTDTVFFVGGIDRGRLSFHQDGDDLVMLLDGDLTQQVRVLGHFLGGEAAISYVQPTDGGYAIPAGDIAGMLTALPGDSGSDGGGSGDTGGTTPPDGGGDTGADTPPTAQTGGADSLTGTAGNDVLLGGADNDTLDGNGGSDLLRGGVGDDTYVFGGGKAVLAEEDGADTLRFTNGITFNSVASGLMKSGDDLVLMVNGGPDQVTLQGFFRGGSELIETITFDTGGSLTADQIFGAFGMAVPDGSSPYAATVEGSNGDDALVQDGAEAERLLGYNGADTLEGAGGDDLLIGGRGDDTYVFRSGDGQDVIDNTGGGYDTLQFADAGFNDVASGLMKSGDDLVLKVSGGPDQVTLRGFFRGGDEAIDRLVFSDGSLLDKVQIFGAFGLGDPDPDGSPDYTGLPDERAYGTVQAARADGETLFGSSDADLIDGGAGNDVIDGGIGDDWLIGGRGDDVFLQGRDGGADTITAYDPTAGKTDTLRFGADIRIDQLWFERSGDDLSVSIIGTGDSATVSGWYAGEAYHVERIETADGHVLLDAQVENLVSAMAAFAPPAAGETSLPASYQDDLQPVIAANWQ